MKIAASRNPQETAKHMKRSELMKLPIAITPSCKK